MDTSLNQLFSGLFNDIWAGLPGWLQALGALACLISLPGSLYLALLTLAALCAPAQRASKKLNAASAALEIVLLVPAHNESEGILRTLRSLKAALLGDSHARIVVVADNCEDDTAALARAEGVEVLERHDPLLRGKGHALRYAFEHIGVADWFIVIDADTDVERDFLPRMRRAMASDADALQCRYRVRDPLSHPRATLADVALGAWNVLRPRGRAALGLSAGILGNGFALSRRTLQRLPYGAGSIVEDVEYHQMLLQAGLGVHWVDDTQVRGDMPAASDAAAQQRARWEGGRLRLLLDRAVPLLGAVMSGRWRLLDPLLDLCLLPLAWHCALLLLALWLGGPLAQLAASLGLLVLALHVGLALHLIGAGRAHLLALLDVPLYLCWKLGLAGRVWRSAQRRAAWVRSARRQP
ncbi:glycosyltransferase [Paucibacter sp. AS339]|uniref:glycosyltransferase family 2 protein n=1 Tax=Paucibacter hankyongi TaxID=3133434 RepID=UPI0030B63469